MDLCSFINSKAISKHLLDINYEFNIIEAAWLIYQCKSISMNEKHEAWKQLINEMPDCKLAERTNCKAKESFHEFLKKYMQIEEWLYQVFQMQQELNVYTLRFYCVGDEDWSTLDGEELFYSCKTCFNAIKSYQEFESEGVELFEITKKLIGGFKTITVTFKSDNTVLAVDSSHYLDSDELDIMGTFDELWFDFPVPFRKGDLLFLNASYGPRTKLKSEEPFVLEDIAPWNTAASAMRKSDGIGNNRDMIAKGYFLCSDGRVSYSTISNYMDLDYFIKIKWSHRFMFDIGKYLIGSMDLEKFLASYRKLVMATLVDNNFLKECFGEAQTKDVKLAILEYMISKEEKSHDYFS